MTEPKDTPSPDLIPVENLRRLDLRPGEKLAVIAPDWISTMHEMAEFDRRVRAVTTDRFGIPAAVFPPGTKLEIVSPQQQPEPRRHEYPVGGAPVAPADPIRQIQQP